MFFKCGNQWVNSDNITNVAEIFSRGKPMRLVLTTNRQDPPIEIAAENDIKIIRAWLDEQADRKAIDAPVGSSDTPLVIKLGEASLNTQLGLPFRMDDRIKIHSASCPDRTMEGRVQTYAMHDLCIQVDFVSRVGGTFSDWIFEKVAPPPAPTPEPVTPPANAPAPLNVPPAAPHLLPSVQRAAAHPESPEPVTAPPVLPTSPPVQKAPKQPKS